jgi:hypothetical protein
MTVEVQSGVNFVNIHVNIESVYAAMDKIMHAAMLPWILRFNQV